MKRQDVENDIPCEDDFLPGSIEAGLQLSEIDVFPPSLFCFPGRLGVLAGSLDGRHC